MCERFGYDKMVGMVSGTEGADAAVKFSRKWGIKVKGIKPSEVVVLGVSDNYHGVGSGIWPIMNDMGQASGLYYLSRYPSEILFYQEAITLGSGIGC